MRNWRAHSTEPVEASHASAFNAPLFRSVTESLKTRKRWVVLDLGAARAQTIALFGRYGCRLDIANLTEGFDALNAVSEPERLREKAEELLPDRNNEATDVVFCWDILNYLEPPALRAVMSCIAGRARPGALIHALIVYSQTLMSARPGYYVPQADSSLLEISGQPATRPAPRYSPDDLGRAMTDYSIDRVMLLGNGMQEFLFRCEGRG